MLWEDYVLRWNSSCKPYPILWQVERVSIQVHPAGLDSEHNRLSVALPYFQSGFTIGRKMHVMPLFPTKSVQLDGFQKPRGSPVVEVLRGLSRFEAQIDGNGVPVVSSDLQTIVTECEPLLVVFFNDLLEDPHIQRDPCAAGRFILTDFSMGVRVKCGSKSQIFGKHFRSTH
jgi:hypothetical protein